MKIRVPTKKQNEAAERWVEHPKNMLQSLACFEIMFGYMKGIAVSEVSLKIIDKYICDEEKH